MEKKEDEEINYKLTKEKSRHTIKKVYAGAFFIMQRVRDQVEDPLGEQLDGGSGVTIAMLDTGAAPHPDLEGRILCFEDFVRNDARIVSGDEGWRTASGDRSCYDDNGHGTHVAGILCGSGLASLGRYRGLAPGAKLVVGKVLDEKGDGITENMLEGLEWVLSLREMYRIRILNISVGIGDLEDKRKEYAMQEKLDEIWDRGIMVVCAAGNKGPGEGSVSAVGNSAKVVTVGCHDGNFRLGSPWRCQDYSGRGIAGAIPRKPDLVAPGTDIVSCSAGCYQIRGRYLNAYAIKSGTSMATPIVSAAAALAMQRFPGMTNEECKQKLLQTAADLGEPWNQQGWGMLNVRRLLQ